MKQFLLRKGSISFQFLILCRHDSRGIIQDRCGYVMVILDIVSLTGRRTSYVNVLFVSLSKGLLNHKLDPELPFVSFLFV